MQAEKIKWLHLGNEIVVNTEEIIGIFDLDNTTVSRHTRDMLSQAQKENRVITVSMELPKSFIVCRREENFWVYLSQISPSTLLKRSSFSFRFE